MFMRIAPELYLKRLLVGGFERVFELNRNFRNEGVSPRHNPEFTMMEFYAAYVDYKWLMDFTETVIRQAVVDTYGTPVITYQGKELDFSKPFRRFTILEAISKYAPHYTLEQLNDADFLRAELKNSASNSCRPLAWVPCNSPCSKKRPKRNSGNRLTSSTTLSKYHHWPARPIPAKALRNASSSSWSAVKSPTVSPN